MLLELFNACDFQTYANHSLYWWKVYQKEKKAYYKKLLFKGGFPVVYTKMLNISVTPFSIWWINENITLKPDH